MNHTIHRFETLDSTMLKAAELAGSGAESGTVVVAGAQTAGQGRVGRSWYSERDTGLYMTEILRLDLPPETLPVVTLALGLATAEAISEIAVVKCDLRWPNDVMVADKKCAGILAQFQSGVLLAGIGINVNQTGFVEDLADIATSLRATTGREHSREALLSNLIGQIDRWLNVLAQEGKENVIEAFARVSSYARGRRVTVDVGGSDIGGVTDGLDAHGFLYVREDDGRRTRILAGGIRPECS